MIFGKKIVEGAVALLSGFLVATAFPPFQSGQVPVWVALVPLLWLLRRSTPKGGFLLGLLSGLGFWVTTLCWFPAIIKNDGPWFLVLLGWMGLALLCASYWAWFGLLSSALWQKFRDRGVGARLGLILIADPLLWVGIEWVRSWLFSGFAWNFLGVSQAENPPMIQIASLVGVYGVSLLILWANGALTSLAERMFLPIWMKIRGMNPLPESRGTRFLRGLESGLPFVLILIVWFWGSRRVATYSRTAQGESWLITLVQPNAPCIFNLDLERTRRQFRLLQEQTQLANLTRPDLVVWPETAAPGGGPRSRATLDFIGKSIGPGGAPLLSGMVELERVVPTTVAPKGILSYNAAYLLNADLKILGGYRKQHLVPFGEYIPFDKQLPFLQKLAPTGFSCTPGTDAGIMTLTNAAHRSALRIGPLICFEDTVSSLSRQAVLSGANLLALMTNDAWFNHSCEPVQHAWQAIFRAVENGVPMIRAANSGVSCVVDPVGRVKRLEMDGMTTDFHGFLNQRIRAPAEVKLTPYTRFGDGLLAIPGALLGLGLTLFLIYRRRRRSARKGL